jgi:hypothetical protein
MGENGGGAVLRARAERHQLIHSQAWRDHLGVNIITTRRRRGTCESGGAPTTLVFMEFGEKSFQVAVDLPSPVAMDSAEGWARLTRAARAQLGGGGSGGEAESERERRQEPKPERHVIFSFCCCLLPEQREMDCLQLLDAAFTPTTAEKPTIWIFKKYHIFYYDLIYY